MPYKLDYNGDNTLEIHWEGGYKDHPPPQVHNPKKAQAKYSLKTFQISHKDLVLFLHTGIECFVLIFDWIVTKLSILYQPFFFC